MENERDSSFTSAGNIGGIDQATDFSQSASGSGSATATNMGNMTDQPMIGRAKEMANTMGQRAAERVQERIGEQKDRATDTLENVASSLRMAGENMTDQNGLGRYMVQAATQVDNLASFLNNREVTELFDEVEDFARRQPAVFIGGAFALGILGARFLRSSRRGIDGANPSWQSTTGSTPRYDQSVGRTSMAGDIGYSTRDTGTEGYRASTGTSGTANQGYSAGSSGTPGHSSGTMDNPNQGSSSTGGSTGTETSGRASGPDYL